MGPRNHQRLLSLALALLLLVAGVGVSGAFIGANGVSTDESPAEVDARDDPAAAAASTVSIDGTFSRMKTEDGEEYVPIEDAYAQLIVVEDGQRSALATQQLGEDGAYSFEVSDREVSDYYGGEFYVATCAATDAARIADTARIDEEASTATVDDDTNPAPPRTVGDGPATQAAAQRATRLPAAVHDESSDAVCGYEAAGDASGALYAIRTDTVRAYDAADLTPLEGEWRPPAGEDYNVSGAFSALEAMQEMYDRLAAINASTDTWPGQQRVQVRWPGEGTFFSHDYYVSLQADSDHDAYREDTVQHEYGHAVMTDLYTAGRYPDSGRPDDGGYRSPSPHNPEMLSNPPFALQEGWAEFVPTAVDRNATYRSYEPFAVESTNFYEDIAAETDDRVYGADGEGVVLNVFYEIADDGTWADDGVAGADDDGVDGRFAAIWRIMKQDNPDNITHFRALWYERGLGDRQALDEIYDRHGIPPRDEPFFQYTRSSVDPDTRIEPGREVIFSTTLENRQPVDGTTTVELVVDGETVETETVAVESRTRRSVLMTRTFEAPGTYEVEYGGETYTFTVEDIEQPQIHAREITANTSTPAVGEPVEFTVTYENVGEETGEVDLLPTLNGDPAYSFDPETLEVRPGETTTTTIVWEFDRPMEYEIGAADVFDSATTDITVVEEGTEPDIAVTSASLGSSTIGAGESVTVAATVENAGDGAGTATVELTVDGSVVDTREVSLESGSSTTIQFERTFDSAGTYDLAVDGVAAGTLTVEAAGSPDIGVTSASLSRSTIPEGESVTVAASVENDGDAAGSATLELTVDGTVLDTREVTLEAGESTTVEFQRTFDSAGTYDLAVEGVAAGTLTVEESSSTCTVVQAVAAFDDDPTTIGESDYDTAYSYYYYGAEVPNTGGETISYRQMLTIQDRYRSGATVEPCT